MTVGTSVNVGERSECGSRAIAAGSPERSTLEAASSRSYTASAASVCTNQYTSPSGPVGTCPVHDAAYESPAASAPARVRSWTMRSSASPRMALAESTSRSIHSSTTGPAPSPVAPVPVLVTFQETVTVSPTTASVGNAVSSASRSACGRAETAIGSAAALLLSFSNSGTWRAASATTNTV